jgi:1-acyl-sn-glycerol-3-phosphate acyltransferase
MGIVRRQFHEIVFDAIAADKNRSLLLIANHFSFWDGLILYYVNEKLLKKKFHVMMGEETAKSINVLKYVGAFTILKNSREVLQSLDYAAKLLNDSQNMVLIFPQGKLYSNFVTNIHFEKGIIRMMKQAQGKFQFIFSATFIQYFKHKKPTATVYLKSETENYADKGIDQLTGAYQQYYDSVKGLQTEFDIK